MTGLSGLLSALTAVAIMMAGTSASAGGLVVCPAGDTGQAPQSSPVRLMSSAEHCSSFALDNGGRTVFGSNYDDSYWDDGLVFVSKRGVVKTSLFAGTTGAHAHWVSSYSSVTFSLLGYGYAWAGMNERGLVISTMSLRVTRSPATDARPPLDSGEWMQYLLDTCATIAEVIATDAVVRILTVDHYLVADAHGHAAAVEFLSPDGRPHRDRDAGAGLTSNTYSSVNRLSYRQVGSTNYWGSTGRCIASAWRRIAPTRSAVRRRLRCLAFETLERVAGRGSGRTSQWSIVFDTANGRVWYRTVRHPEIRFVDLAQFDPWCTAPVRMLDIHAGPAGDVTTYFSDYSHDTNLDRMRDFLRAWGIPFTEEGLLWTVRYLEGFPCQRYRPPRRSLERRP
jgi:hypothetical protein